jgi:hypothetical protein
MNQQPGPEILDIHLPEAISWWPLAMGWWLAFVLILGFLSVAIWYWRKKSTARRPLREALNQLQNIEHDYHQNQSIEDLICQLSSLLRVVAITLYGRDEIARMNGQQWLQFLDSKLAKPEFLEGDGQIFGEGPYQAKITGDCNAKLLIQLTRNWIQLSWKGAQ